MSTETEKKDSHKPGRLIALCMAIGAGAGAGVGVALDNIAIGVGLGVAVGLMFGAILEQRKKTKSNS
jgi:H+/Cl- antiporter ClcA